MEQSCTGTRYPVLSFARNRRCIIVAPLMLAHVALALLSKE